jgi:hypothetical protein
LKEKKQKNFDKSQINRFMTQSVLERLGYNQEVIIMDLRKTRGEDFEEGLRANNAKSSKYDVEIGSADIPEWLPPETQTDQVKAKFAATNEAVVGDITSPEKIQAES